MHHARKPSMHLNRSPSQLTSRHVTSLATPVQTCLDSPGATPGSVPKSPSHTYLLTGRAVTASCPATAPVHVWKAPRCLGSFKSPHKGRAGGQPPKNAWVQGRCDRDRGKKLHVSDSTSQGTSGPHNECITGRAPAAGPLLRNQYLALVSQPAVMLQPRAVKRTGDTTK